MHQQLTRQWCGTEFIAMYRFLCAIVAVLISACALNKVDYTAYAVSEKLAGDSKFPIAFDVSMVGKYPAYTDSGAGYFYDDVLEYRVWLHPEKGAPDRYEGSDYYTAFSQYELAKEFSLSQIGAEEPLVLIRQVEWVDEPKPGQYLHIKEERITEWQVRWLKDAKREEGSIESFIKNPRKIRY